MEDEFEVAKRKIRKSNEDVWKHFEAFVRETNSLPPDQAKKAFRRQPKEALRNLPREVLDSLRKDIREEIEAILEEEQAEGEV